MLVFIAYSIFKYKNWKKNPTFCLYCPCGADTPELFSDLLC